MDIFTTDSPIGPLTIATRGDALKAIYFGSRENSGAPTALALQVQRELREYFAGARMNFDIHLGLEGTDFQIKVWAALADIPYGETRSYGQIAQIIGSPKAARAVGMACNKNPIPIIIPCHRVVGASGSLTGYAGGLETKKYLLNFEKQISEIFS